MQLASEDKIVAQTNIGTTHISTLFLSLDHGFDPENPQVFETMVFRDGEGADMWRYSTWQEAVEGHERACRGVTCGFTREELEAAKAIIENMLPSP